MEAEIRQRGSLTRWEDLAWLVVAEYQEMPGMRLTFAQVKRVWDLSSEDCSRLLDYLVSSGRLTQDEDGRFVLGHLIDGAHGDD